MKATVLAFTRAVVLMVAAVSAQALDIQVYNPGDKGIFPVSSELVTGEHDAILVDAQFDVINGQALVDTIKNSGKTLQAIYISAGDPDYYFGLEPILAAFPGVKVLASQAVVDHIIETKDAKLSYWGPILGKGAPKTLTVPEVMTSDSLTLEGEIIEVKAMNTHNAFLWAPAEKTVFGGVAVTHGQHVWMADSQTTQARAEWIAALDQIIALKPQRVIPGHFLGQIPQGTESVVFTRDYVQRFETELAKANDSAELVAVMKQAYPQLPEDDGLTIGAKVATSEMQW